MLLDQKHMVRDFDKQAAEHQVRIVILNRCTGFCIPVADHFAERGCPAFRRFRQ